ncbi:MAG: hypothetical protein ACK5PP_00565 [Acidimicrobiales bacterium]
MSDEPSDHPLEPLIELFVYAPIGFIYEYEEVLPQLIRRGRSQVQLARFFGRMAAERGGAGGGDATGADLDVGSLLTTAASTVTRLLKDVDAAMQTLDRRDAERAATAPQDGVAGRHDGPGQDGAESGGADGTVDDRPRPDDPEDEAGGELSVPDAGGVADLGIDGYDDLTARTIIELLDELSPQQRAAVAAHETANRGRKTVLAKLARLADG